MARAVDTRDRILVAAADQFAARGFHGTATRDIARAVAWVVSDDAAFVHGAVLAIDGGISGTRL